METTTTPATRAERRFARLAARAIDAERRRRERRAARLALRRIARLYPVRSAAK